MSYVLIENTDYITAYNGLSAATIPLKGWHSTQISNNCFNLLHRYNIPNHFVSAFRARHDGCKFWAYKLRMIPVEFVVRHRAYGSYVKRYPDARIGEAFLEPIVEFFEKDDAMNDPWLVVDRRRGAVSRYEPDQPKSTDSLIDTRPIHEVRHLMLDYWSAAASIVRKASIVLQKAWEESNATLVDIKFECGLTEDNRILIGDSIDADCWRLWRNNDPADPLDRQLFKNDCTPDQILEAQRFILRRTKQWDKDSHRIYR